MINFNNIKLFDKKGYQIDLKASSYYTIKINSKTGYGFIGYPVLDINGNITDVVIENTGYNYATYIEDDNNITYNSNITSLSIYYKDVIIFDNIIPIIEFEKLNASSNIAIIKKINISQENLNVKNSSYPNITYTGILYLDNISVDLFETQNVYLFDNELNNIADENNLLFEIESDENTFNLFDINIENNTLNTFNNEVFELNGYNNTVNISFSSSEEGVYEGHLKIFYCINDIKYLFCDILLMCESIGEDYRYRDLLSNFGLPDPKLIPTLFKECNINEDNIDYNIINEKSKFLALEYQNIFSYIGTYKALINSVKWLGYDDIYFKEWFLNVKNNKLSSFKLSYNNNDNTILNLSFDERNNFKKLNKLSLIYLINKVNGKYDENDIPETENCYNYSLSEIQIKLYALKKWLEDNIIGVNCKIADITGEAIFFNKYENKIYSNIEKTFDLKHELNITPTTKYDIDIQNSIYYNIDNYVETYLDKDSKSANLYLGIKELSIDSDLLSVEHLTYDVEKFIEFYNNSNVLNPIYNLSEIQWKGSIKTKTATINNDFVTNELLIIDNTIKFYNPEKSESKFKCDTSNILILLENAKLRNISYDWNNNIKYTIEKTNNKYVIFDNTYNINSLYESNTYIVLETNADTELKYYHNKTLNCPILTIKNFNIRYFDTKTNYIHVNEELILDIIDGKIACFNKNNPETYINFNYDNVLNKEQEISANFVYYSERITLNTQDNFINTLKVNHIGTYDIELIAYDDYNNIYNFKLDKEYHVLGLYNDFNIFINSSEGDIDINDIYEYTPDYMPIYDLSISYADISLYNDYTKNIHVSFPSITYYNKITSAKYLDCLFLGKKINPVTNRTFTYESPILNKNVNICVFDKKYQLIKEQTQDNIVFKNNSTFSIENNINNLDINDELYLINLYNPITINKFYKSNDIYNNFRFKYKPGFKINDIVKLKITLYAYNKETDTSHEYYSMFASCRVTDINFINKQYICSLRCSIPFWFLNDEGNVYDINNKLSLNDENNLSTQNALSVISYKNIDNDIDTFYYDVKLMQAWESSVQMFLKIKNIEESNNVVNVYPYKHNMLNYIDDNFILQLKDFNMEYLYEIWNKIENNKFIKLNNIKEITKKTDIILTSNNINNIWEVYKDNELLFKVYNDIVPITLSKKGTYTFINKKYDEYGNIYITKRKNFIVYK